MVKGNELLGAILIYGQEVRLFTDKQIELVTTFADQAVIAIENARLFNEVQARTEDLRESLQQQTATADVLKVISRSAFDLQTVLDTLVESAVELSGAPFGTIFQKRGDLYHLTAQFGYTPEMLEYGHAHPIAPGIGSNVGRTAMTAAVIQIPDVLTDPDYTASGTSSSAISGQCWASRLCAREAGRRVFSGKPQPGPFAERQVQLVQTFADQAAIAIDNVRLFNELQARTRDLSESLQQQTATSEVLQVINSSPGHLQPVFAAMLQKATQLCEAAFGILWLCDGEKFQAGALHGVPAAYSEIARKPVRPLPTNPLGRMLRGERLIVSADVADEEPYRAGDPVRRALVDLAGARSVIQVALLKDDVLLGSLTVYRQEVRPFSEKQIALLQNFAAQGVIAIENARLITATREALERQTATADVLQVINSSPGNLAPVFEAILEKALALCDAAFGILWTYDGSAFTPPHCGAWRRRMPNF